MDKKAEALAAAKRAAGYKAADMITDGMVVGLGTGSTVYYMIERLSTRVKKGLEVSGIPTSFQTALRAREAGISLTTMDDHPVIDIAIDGADEVDPKLRLIKGRGAAHLREKCMAAASKRFVVVVDEQKIVKNLGTAAVPVEVLPFAVMPVLNDLRGLGCEPIIREAMKKDGPVITDNGNFIVDCKFSAIKNPEKLEAAIAAIPGVVESGLFCGFTKKTTVIVGGIKKCTVITSPDVVT
ncbi:MAG: ribose 5-phosphate isomerase A [Methanoregula sp.]|jgi:ribose 5-phosphate isomerase A|nr:ribose 5-phosphate isomerase A [Methanoregula sp.]